MQCREIVPIQCLTCQPLAYTYSTHTHRQFSHVIKKTIQISRVVKFVWHSKFYDVVIILFISNMCILSSVYILSKSRFLFMSVVSTNECDLADFIFIRLNENEKKRLSQHKIYMRVICTGTEHRHCTVDDVYC